MIRLMVRLLLVLVRQVVIVMTAVVMRLVMEIGVRPVVILLVRRVEVMMKLK